MLISNLYQWEIPSDCIRGFTNSSVHSSKVVNRINLSIYPNEMVIILYTRKRNIKRPTLFNKTILLISQVKHLGLTLDKKLMEEAAGQRNKRSL
jgi:hypothetical protein